MNIPIAPIRFFIFTVFFVLRFFNILWYLEAAVVAGDDDVIAVDAVSTLDGFGNWYEVMKRDGVEEDGEEL